MKIDVVAELPEYREQKFFGGEPCAIDLCDDHVGAELQKEAAHDRRFA